MSLGKCKVCGTKKSVKFYIIADDIEHPQPYCSTHIRELQLKVMIQEFVYEQGI